MRAIFGSTGLLLTITQFLIEISASVRPLELRSNARLVRIWPTDATKTATKEVSISLAISAIIRDAVDGDRLPPEEIHLPHLG